ncbi:MAG: hypothetical protein Q8P75_02320 [bacterium]|nr:hypothetical protein [bacterium]
MDKIIFAVLFFLPATASAQIVNPRCTVVGGIPIPSAFCGGIFGPARQRTATDFIVEVINIALFVVGLLAVVFLIIGGFRYITAAGNEEQVEGAKQTIFHAIIGLIIVILSFVIVRVISNALISGRA